jgi:hypothetical protein
MSDIKNLQHLAGRPPLLWEIQCRYKHQVRVDEGFGETRHSHYETRPKTMHVVASSELLARTLFEEEWPARLDYELVSLQALFIVDATIQVSR